MPQARKAQRAIVAEFSERFSTEHGVKISFETEAVERILAKAAEENLGVREFCERAFKDYQFGLTLIKRNSGRLEFTILRARGGESRRRPQRMGGGFLSQRRRKRPMRQFGKEWVSSTAWRSISRCQEKQGESIPKGRRPAVP